MCRQQQFSGTLIRDLSASVDRALALPSVSPSGAVHVEDSAPQDHLDAAMFLADAKMWLANRVMDEGDEHAWWLLDEAQTQCWRGL